jgi:alpha-L-fucosidase 2
VVFQNYIHATQQAGYFSFDHITDENLMKDLVPKLAVHNYNSGTTVEVIITMLVKDLGSWGMLKKLKKKSIPYAITSLLITEDFLKFS